MPLQYQRASVVYGAVRNIGSRKSILETRAEPRHIGQSIEDLRSEGVLSCRERGYSTLYRVAIRVTLLLRFAVHYFGKFLKSRRLQWLGHGD